MSTQAQIEANRKNAQQSTGATSEDGRKKSSLNAIQHGFTGQKVFVTAEQKLAYEAHCAHYRKQYNPKTHEEIDLMQQYADQQWTLHQISIQEMNVITFMNATTEQHLEAGSDVDTINKAMAPYYQQLKTIGIYEGRRRRAATATFARFHGLVETREAALKEAALVSTVLKMQGKTFEPAEFGFVCSSQEIEEFLNRQTAHADVKKFIAEGSWK
jgi:hypothetical protein